MSKSLFWDKNKRKQLAFSSMHEHVNQFRGVSRLDRDGNLAPTVPIDETIKERWARQEAAYKLETLAIKRRRNLPKESIERFLARGGKIK